MSTKSNVLTSPVGQILFMAVDTPVKASKTEDKKVYTIKIAFDNKTDKTFLSKVAEINKAKVVTAKTYRGENEAIVALLETGKSIVSSSSKFKPLLFDKEGNELEESPMFFTSSTGTAQMLVEPYIGEKGGTINLVGIKIHTLDNGEQTGITKEERLAQLRALAKIG